MPFSHAHHVGGIGIDCRYCHTSVEKAAFAGIPPTKTCMNCHSQIWNQSPTLEPVRESYRTDKSIEWVKVHDLPDFVYFNHSAHVNKGVGCTTCHGRVDKMPLMWQEESLQMEWCLDCHRAPEKYVRPRAEVFNVAWEAAAEPARRGAKARDGVPDPRPHELLDVPPMSAESRVVPAVKVDLSGVRRRLRRDAGPRPTGGASRSWPRRRSSSSSCTASSRSRPPSSPTRPGAASSCADGRLAGARGPDGLHPAARREDRPVREAARGDRAGPAALLRDRRARRRLREGRAGREPHGPADQDRGQPRAPGQPGRDRRAGPGRGPRPLRPRPLADRHAPTARSARGARSWPRCKPALAKQKPIQGAGLRILTETVTSPTLAEQLEALLAEYPQASWHQ